MHRFMWFFSHIGKTIIRDFSHRGANKHIFPQQTQGQFEIDFIIHFMQGYQPLDCFTFFPLKKFFIRSLFFRFNLFLLFSFLFPNYSRRGGCNFLHKQKAYENND